MGLLHIHCCLHRERRESSQRGRKHEAAYDPDLDVLSHLLTHGDSTLVLKIRADTVGSNNLMVCSLSPTILDHKHLGRNSIYDLGNNSLTK